MTGPLWIKYCHSSAKVVFDKFFLINADNLYTSERKIKRARRIISRNLTREWKVVRCVDILGILNNRDIHFPRTKRWKGECIFLFVFKIKEFYAIYRQKNTATSLKSKWHWTEDFVVVNREWWVIKSKYRSLSFESISFAS